MSLAYLVLAGSGFSDASVQHETVGITALRLLRFSSSQGRTTVPAFLITAQYSTMHKLLVVIKDASGLVASSYNRKKGYTNSTNTYINTP